MSSESAGMMSGLFFVGKGELLRWLNDFFQINYTKVEEAASGAIHCQILDSIFPGRVPLHKVNFSAKYDYEFVHNYKVLQEVFTKEGLKKAVDVPKLVQGKFQDNLEFLQWMKHLWDTRYTGGDYDAVARREEAIAMYNREHKFSGKPSTAPAASRAKPAPRVAPVVSRPTPAARPAPTVAPARPAPVSRAPAPAAKLARPASKPAPAEAEEAPASQEEVNELNSTVAKLRLTIEGLEKERNFYFGKLREIEILCQTDETKDNETKQKVLEILYQTDEDFEQPANQEAEQPPPQQEEAQEEFPADPQDDGVDGVVDDEDDLANY